MQKNPEAINKSEVLLSHTYTGNESWTEYPMLNIQDYSFMIITFIGTVGVNGSYSTAIAIEDFRNTTQINNNLYLCNYENASNSILLAYKTDTSVNLYNTHGAGTLTIRGIR